jgi:hypothetical protein
MNKKVLHLTLERITLLFDIILLSPFCSSWEAIHLKSLSLSIGMKFSK